MEETKNTAAKQQEHMSAKDTVPGISADDAALLDDVQGKIRTGLENGDRSQTDALMQEQSKMLGEYGIVYPDGTLNIPKEAPKPGDFDTDNGTTQQADGGELPDYTGQLKNWHDGAARRQSNTIDYATRQGINEVERAQQDAQEQFQSQLNQTNREEAKALDNQVLYAEARGDRGGIGQAQYAQIQSTAMENRRTIHVARTKLATDTARQIADLRARGEFQEQVDRWNAEFALTAGEGQRQETSLHTQEQVQLALEALRRGAAGDEVRGILENYYGVSFELIAKANGVELQTKGLEIPFDPVAVFEFDEENKSFYWDGVKYSSVESLVAAINARNLNEDQVEAMAAELGKYGFDMKLIEKD